ncbi:MAG TPA: hypothetical protein VHE83_14195 [Mycobacteriales bacterium]|nr:hypothetical protein [Mycobacteriales bacterium]
MITAPGRTTRVAGGLLAIFVATSLTAACKANAGREVVVQFVLDPTTHLPAPSAVQAVRTDCPGNADLVMEPAPTSKLLSVLQHPVRYDANKADDRTVSQLFTCIQAVPGVRSVGLTETDS